MTLQHLRLGSPKWLGAGTTGRSLNREHLKIKPATLGCHLNRRNRRTQVGLADIRDHVEEIIHSTFGTEARSAIRPVFRSSYPTNIDADYLHSVNGRCRSLTGSQARRIRTPSSTSLDSRPNAERRSAARS